tara:strand:- start:307 stop:633 length:327 start_codon:yes stop_codon:yes gene_type:complete
MKQGGTGMKQWKRNGVFNKQQQQKTTAKNQSKEHGPTNQTAVVVVVAVAVVAVLLTGMHVVDQTSARCTATDHNPQIHIAVDTGDAAGVAMQPLQDVDVVLVGVVVSF